MRWGGALFRLGLQQEKTMYAYCGKCNQLYLDQIPVEGSVKCPTCRDCCVVRGLTREEALEKIDPDQRELIQ